MTTQPQPSLLKAFRVPILITLAVLVGSFMWRGADFVTTVAILGVLEFVFSFDNAIVNSKILTRMTPFWRTMFLTAGILVAVGFMRLLFPVIVVVSTAHLGFGQVWNLAVSHPAVYAADLHAAHPAIAALGGMFLAMIFLDWIFDQRLNDDGEPDSEWLEWFGPLERALRKLGKEDIVASIVALLALWVVAEYFSGGHTVQVLEAGLIGWIAYQAVNLLGKFTERLGDKESASESGSGHKALKLVGGAAGFALFVKLEFIDASFSFDGVSGAFAITSDIFAIMLGLGIGAVFIRTLTIYLTAKGTLGEYVYLEHGAHWAIGALAVVLFGTMEHDLPEYVTGGIGLGLILAAYISSLVYRRRHPQELAAEAQEIDAPLKSATIS